MKRLLLLLFVLSVVPLLSAEEWTKTYNLTGNPELRVETSDAKLNVDTWDQNKIEAHVYVTGYKIGPGGIEVQENQSGNSVSLEVRYPTVEFHVMNIKRHRVEIEIHMPRQGRVDLKTGDGSIRLTGLKGEMTLTSGDGSQEIEDVEGVLHARAGDGHIRANGRFDGLSVHTGDGLIDATARPESTMKSDWDIHTGDGSVTLRIPEKLAANVDFETKDGHLDVGMPLTVSGRIKDNVIHGTINGGGNLLTIHTGDGSIRVERS